MKYKCESCDSEVSLNDSYCPSCGSQFDTVSYHAMFKQIASLEKERDELSSKLDKTYEDKEEKMEELGEEIQELEKELAELFVDMEEEAGAAGEGWTDADGNRYGKKMNEINSKIDKKVREKMAIKSSLEKDYIKIRQVNKKLSKLREGTLSALKKKSGR